MYLSHSLCRAAAQNADKTATIYQDRTVSYGELAERAAKLADSLQKKYHIQVGDRLAVLAHNSDLYMEFLLACWWLGAVAVPLNTRWSAHEIEYAITHTDARMLWVDEHHLALAQTISTPTPIEQTYLSRAPAPSDLIDLEQLISVGNAQPAQPIPGDALAVILFTGGTTGKAKGVMLSHSNLWAAATGRLSIIPNKPHFMSSLLIAPMFHAAGLGRLVSQLITASPTLFHHRFQPDLLLADLHSYQIRDVVLVPSMLQAIAYLPTFNAKHLATLHRIVYGAAPMPPSLLEHAMKQLPHVEFLNSYGMTESAAAGTLNGPYIYQDLLDDKYPIFSSGRANAGFDVQIIDDEAKPLPLGTIGEIALRGPSIMQGYWRNPEETKKALQKSWYRSGDAGYLDEKGYLYLVDRLKDMIITGGENVYSVEVENTLKSHPNVEQCAVVGLACPIWGEVIHAVVVLKNTEYADEKENHDFDEHCRQLMASYKCPKHYHVLAELPMSAAGKVLKNEIRNQLQQAIKK